MRSRQAQQNPLKVRQQIKAQIQYMLAPGSSWQHPFFNILANFPVSRRAQTTNVKEVNIHLTILQYKIPRTTQSANSLVLEVCLDDNSIRKFIFGSLYNTPKISGNQISLPFPIHKGTWTQICVDAKGLCDYFFLHKEKQFTYPSHAQLIQQTQKQNSQKPQDFYQQLKPSSSPELQIQTKPKKQ
ncbi:MAG: hypothetical protein EZS28_016933, partial [Streblomastix strix]